MSTLAIILIVVLILCLAGGGWGYRSGAMAGNAGSILWLILVVLLIVFLLRALGVL